MQALFILYLCFIVDAGKTLTNQKVFSSLGNNTLNKLSSHSLNHLHMENNRHTFASHHRTTVRPCLSHKLQTIHRTPLQKKENKSRNIEQDERLVSESVTLSQFRVNLETKSNKGKIKAIRVVYEIITCNVGSKQHGVFCVY